MTNAASKTRDDGVPVTAEPDVYGQVHPVESPELLQEKLDEFNTEVAKLAPEVRVNIDHAQEKCPELLDAAFKLLFLRSEVFHVDLAVQRYAAYWDKRVELFGMDKAFLPLTLDGALKDDHEGLKIAFMQLTGTKDPSGRSIIFVNPCNQDRTKHTRESLTRAVWYIFHSELTASLTMQQKGVVAIGFLKYVELKHVDRQQFKLNLESIRGCIPVRMSGFHMCHPPAFFAKVVFPILKLFLGERLRKRIRLHSGTEEKILERLKEPYGLSKDVLPTEVGGVIVLDCNQWLEDRAAKGL